MGTTIGDVFWMAVGSLGFMGFAFATVAFCLVFLSTGGHSAARVIGHLLNDEQAAMLASLRNDLDVTRFMNMSNVAGAAVFVLLVAVLCVADIALTLVRETIRQRSKAPSQDFMVELNPSYDDAIDHTGRPSLKAKKVL